MLSYHEINAFGQQIKEQLLDGDEAILVSFSVQPADVDCSEPSCVATVSGKIGKQQVSFTGHAVHLSDAIHLARGKLRAAKKAK